MPGRRVREFGCGPWLGCAAGGRSDGRHQRPACLGFAWQEMERPAEVGGELRAGGVTLRRGLRQRLCQHRVDSGRDTWPTAAYRWRRLVELGVEKGDALVAAERRDAAEQLECCACKRVLVGATVGIAAFDLLRRDIVQGAHELAGGSEIAGQRLFADPEVGEVDMLGAVVGSEPVIRPGRCARIQEYVGWLDIAVDQATGMGGVESGRNLGDDAPYPGSGPAWRSSVRASPPWMYRITMNSDPPPASPAS